MKTKHEYPVWPSDLWYRRGQLQTWHKTVITDVDFILFDSDNNHYTSNPYIRILSLYHN
jgi:hypothetical protein